MTAGMVCCMTVSLMSCLWPLQILVFFTMVFGVTRLAEAVLDLVAELKQLERETNRV